MYKCIFLKHFDKSYNFNQVAFYWKTLLTFDIHVYWLTAWQRHFATNSTRSLNTYIVAFLATLFLARYSFIILCTWNTLLFTLWNENNYMKMKSKSLNHLLCYNLCILKIEMTHDMIAVFFTFLKIKSFQILIIMWTTQWELRLYQIISLGVEDFIVMNRVLLCTCLIKRILNNCH